MSHTYTNCRPQLIIYIQTLQNSISSQHFSQCYQFLLQKVKATNFTFFFLICTSTTAFKLSFFPSWSECKLVKDFFSPQTQTRTWMLKTMNIILMKIQTQCLREDEVGVEVWVGRSKLPVNKELQSSEATWFARKDTGIRIRRHGFESWLCHSLAT